MSRNRQIYQFYTGAESSSPSIDSVLRLNVGGRKFYTGAEYIEAQPPSRIKDLFLGEAPAILDEDGSIIIDRDGRLFHHILSFLRDGTVPMGLSRVDCLELMREAQYYEIWSLYKQLAPKPAAGDDRTGSWLQGAIAEQAKDELVQFCRGCSTRRIYARIRFGKEYGGNWIVTSPRDLGEVDYESIHGGSACLARDPVTAINKMSKAGYLPCDLLPKLPQPGRTATEDWEMVFYKDIKENVLNAQEWSQRPPAPTRALLGQRSGYPFALGVLPRGDSWASSSTSGYSAVGGGVVPRELSGPRVDSPGYSTVGIGALPKAPVSAAFSAYTLLTRRTLPAAPGSGDAPPPEPPESEPSVDDRRSEGSSTTDHPTINL